MSDDHEVIPDEDEDEVDTTPECRGVLRGAILHLDREHDPADVLNAMFMELYAYGLYLNSGDMAETDKLMRYGMRSLKDVRGVIARSMERASLH